MAHPLHHSESSVRKFGGKPEDYLKIHSWFDATKAHEGLPIHRALRHHTFGIFECESVFGNFLTNSDGRRVPVRFLGEQHVLEDCRKIPSVSDWLRQIQVKGWMANGVVSNEKPEYPKDPFTKWKEDVANSKTQLGFKEWLNLQKIVTK